MPRSGRSVSGTATPSNRFWRSPRTHGRFQISQVKWRWRPFLLVLLTRENTGAAATGLWRAGAIVVAAITAPSHAVGHHVAVVMAVSIDCVCAGHAATRIQEVLRSQDQLTAGHIGKVFWICEARPYRFAAFPAEHAGGSTPRPHLGEAFALGRMAADRSLCA